MKILNFIAIFLLVSSIFGYPSKPLDERSTELTWQAWLLVDDQNQNKQNNEGANMKKKVIAKSVFIVPPFNPEKLPPCAEGYASDSMGRCLEVFQVDTKNQLQFLLSKLQSHLESSHKISNGPEKFTIAIPGNDSENDDTGAALVLTQNPKSSEKTQNNMVVSSENPDIHNIKIEDKNPEEIMETTTAIPTTTSISTETETTTDPAATELIFSTVSSFGDEGIMDDATMTVLPVDETTEVISTTFVRDDNRQAIFFKVPPTTTKYSEQPSDFSISSRFQFKDDSQDSTNLGYVSSSKVIFRDSPDASDGDLLTSENVRHTANVVHFPDENHQNIRHDSEHAHSKRQNHEHHGHFNHRNRDKHFWRFKPSWKDPDEQNSFVVKLSNINFNDLLVQNRHSSPMYRQIPAEHLSYIFGRNDNHR